MTDKTMTRWVGEVRSRLPTYLAGLHERGAPLRWNPCRRIATRLGRNIQLGFSCYGMKLYWITGLWEGLPVQARDAWVEYIRSFQAEEGKTNKGMRGNAFVDPVLFRQARRRRLKLSRKAPFVKIVVPSEDRLKSLLLAETKQAMSTLAQVGASARRPFSGYPLDPEDLLLRVSSLDWSLPWHAGAQFANLSAVVAIDMAREKHDGRLESCRSTLASSVKDMLDLGSGAYFVGVRPGYGPLVNGAMKVLSGLDWLGEPVHAPEQLVDTVLSSVPESEGCHLVDAIYVLYRCLKQTRHRVSDVSQYALRILAMIQAHYLPEDGGFSYYTGTSQRSYYGAAISGGGREADLHGTLLLVWAISMICELAGMNEAALRTIKP